jgi:hypothetical protein
MADWRPLHRNLMSTGVTSTSGIVIKLVALLWGGGRTCSAVVLGEWFRKRTLWLNQELPRSCCLCTDNLPCQARLACNFPELPPPGEGVMSACLPACL